MIISFICNNHPEVYDSVRPRNIILIVKDLYSSHCMYESHLLHTTRIPEMLGRFLYLNKMKTKRLSNHMSQNFIHNRT